MTERVSQRRVALVISSTVVAVLLLHYLGALRPVERVIVRALLPVGRWTASWLNPTARTSSREATARVAALGQRIAELNVENAQLRSAFEAVTEADEQDRFLATHQFEGVTARIVTRSADPTSEFITVDRGARTGVRHDAPAIVAGGVIVGRVIAVTDDDARVLLSTDNRSSFTGVSLKTPTAQGVITGARGLSLTMELIPQSESITPGDIIVTSGVDSSVPRGLVLGEIDRIEKQDGALFQSASLRPLYQSARLDVITILTVAR